MSLVLNGNGTIQNLVAGGLPDGSVTADDIASTLDLSGKTVTLPAGTGGKVLQVVQTVKTDTASTSSTSWADISGLSVTITPTSATSKILVSWSIACGFNGGSGMGIRLQRNYSNVAYRGDAAGSRPRTIIYSETATTASINVQSNQWLDSPATTSATTYNFAFYSTNGVTHYINRSVADRDTSLYDARLASSVTVMEIAA